MRKKKLIKISGIGSFIILVLFVVGIVYLFRGLYKEDYCSNLANRKLGSRGYELVEPTVEERENSTVGKSESTRISLFYREILKCEEEYKALFLF